jgi:hypothetical protein
MVIQSCIGEQVSELRTLLSFFCLCFLAIDGRLPEARVQTFVECADLAWHSISYSVLRSSAIGNNHLLDKVACHLTSGPRVIVSLARAAGWNKPPVHVFSPSSVRRDSCYERTPYLLAHQGSTRDL